MIPLKVNKKRLSTEAWSDTPLLWVLRDELGLTGTKFGCGMGLCGACTVHLNGLPIRSCVLPIGNVDKQSVTTIEGLEGPVAEAVQAAWIKLDVAQCGYCQSGQIMSAVALLSQRRAPSESDIESAMSGNICRCASYVRIKAAIHLAAASLKQSPKA